MQWIAVTFDQYFYFVMFAIVATYLASLFCLLGI